ncbi:hypothetical protein [Hirschia litorea]|uniref:Uncharacterized protein n=1 Tax=Hirschia litorea TaxID=1199156 RepID=A0ABW2ILI4_9PROT
MQSNNEKHKDEVAQKSMWSFGSGLLLGLFLALTVVGFWIFGVETPNSESAITQQIEACEAGNFTQCRSAPFVITNGDITPIEDHDKFRDEYRAEKDLKAQRTMAFWSMFMGLVALVGTVLVGLTLRSSLEMLREAKNATNLTSKAIKIAEDTNDITRNIGESQARAWLSNTGLKFNIDRNSGSIRLKMTIENTGNSPAKKFQSFASVKSIPVYKGQPI